MADYGEVTYDYLILACGAKHSYFGKPEWEQYALGLKTLEQATEIRRRVLSAFDNAERETDLEKRKRLLTFVVVGDSPPGVELGGAIGGVSRCTLAKDFRAIDAFLARVILIEAGPRILPMFFPELSTRAVRDLEHLGVQVWTSSKVSDISDHGIAIGSEQIQSATILWAAGVEASSFGRKLQLQTDREGRVIVETDISLKSHPNVFVLGDQLAVSVENPLNQWLMWY